MLHKILKLTPKIKMHSQILEWRSDILLSLAVLATKRETRARPVRNVKQIRGLSFQREPEIQIINNFNNMYIG